MGRTQSQLLSKYFASGEPVIIARVDKAAGSTPREAGASMLITANRTDGTIGGGQLEFRVIETARQMLAEGRDREIMDIALGPELNQCCGGRVKISLASAGAADLEALKAAETSNPPAEVYIFGAGHTGSALARAITLLPLAVTLADSRPQCLETVDTEVQKIATPLPEQLVRDAKPGSAFVVMTHEHAVDFIITAAALVRGDAAYVGMIGSATKRELFARRFVEEGHDRSLLTSLTCPIGANRAGDKRPEVIAAITAAEIAGALFGLT